MGKFLILIFVGYIIQLFSQMVEVAIMKKWGTKEINAGDTLLLSIIGYMIFVLGFVALFYYLYF